MWLGRPDETSTASEQILVNLQHRVEQTFLHMLPDEQTHFRRDAGIHHFSGWPKLKSFSQDFDFQKVHLRIKSNECKPTAFFRPGWTCRPSATVSGHPIPTETSCMGASLGSPMERPPNPVSHWLFCAERLSCYLKALLAFFSFLLGIQLRKVAFWERNTNHEGINAAFWARPTSREHQPQWAPARADGSQPKRSWQRWSHTSVQ